MKIIIQNPMEFNQQNIERPDRHNSPVPCAPPEYLIAPYRPGDYEYIGVPLEPPIEDEDSGPSTREIIASQSQDYVDEKLAEYQATIAHLQGQLTTTFFYFLFNYLTIIYKTLELLIFI